MKPFLLGLMLSVCVVIPADAKMKPDVAQRCRSVEAFEGSRLNMKMLIKHVTRVQLVFYFGRKEVLGRETEMNRGRTSLYRGVVGYVNARGAQIAENPSNPGELTAIFLANGVRQQVTFACEATPFDFNG
jgi:hypothetical protein